MAAIHDHAAANKAHFNAHAHDYDAFIFAKERAQRAAEAIRKACTFNENTTLMEYACGTGLVSRELAPLCKHIVGVDISQSMVDLYNKRNEHKNMSAVCAELKGEPGELGDEKFDIIICCSAYHHFTSIEQVTRVLAYFLKPGGSLVVIDGPKGGYIPPLFAKMTDAHIIAHKGGFDESDMRKAFEPAGLSLEFDLETLRQGEPPEGQEHDADLFIAKGIKL